jgi:hypothetical protein
MVFTGTSGPLSTAMYMACPLEMAEYMLTRLEITAIAWYASLYFWIRLSGINDVFGRGFCVLYCATILRRSWSRTECSSRGHHRTGLVFTFGLSLTALIDDCPRQGGRHRMDRLIQTILCTRARSSIPRLSNPYGLEPHKYPLRGSAIEC